MRFLDNVTFKGEITTNSGETLDDKLGIVSKLTEYTVVQDLEVFGTESNVFNDNSLLEIAISNNKVINNNKCNGKLFDYLLNNGDSIGSFLKNINGISQSVNWDNITTLAELMANDEAFNAVFEANGGLLLNSEIACPEVTNYFIESQNNLNKLLASESVMDAACNSQNCMNTLLKSSYKNTITISDYFSVGSNVNMASILNTGEQITLKHSTYGNIIFDVVAKNYGQNNTITLLTKKCLTSKQWHNSNVNNYEPSDIRTWCNGDLLKGFSTKVQNSMKTPSKACHNYTTSITLNDKIWLPSMTEMGVSYQYSQTEGTKFTYIDRSSKFQTAVDGSSAPSYVWTRTPYSNYSDNACVFNSSGSGSDYYCSVTNGVAVGLTI